jgi:hypothetical protein
MKQYTGMIFIILTGLAIGLLMTNITACGTSGSTSSGYYGSNVNYGSGWGGYYSNRYHHRRPPPRRRR